MNLTEAYARLRDHCGSHRAAARELGLTEQHYNALRNGRANMPSRTADYILLKALELDSGPAVATPMGQAREASP